MENSAGISSRFIWGRDSEPLEKEWRTKPGPQMGGGYTKGVVTSRHGISKLPRFFSQVWEIKEVKIGLFYSPDPWIQWDRVKTVPGNNLSSHYLNPLRMRTAGHAPGLMFHHKERKKDFWSASVQDYHLFFSPILFYLLIGSSFTEEHSFAFGLALIQVPPACTFVHLSVMDVCMQTLLVSVSCKTIIHFYVVGNSENVL